MAHDLLLRGHAGPFRRLGDARAAPPPEERLFGWGGTVFAEWRCSVDGTAVLFMRARQSDRLWTAYLWLGMTGGGPSEGGLCFCSGGFMLQRLGALLLEFHLYLAVFIDLKLVINFDSFDYPAKRSTLPHECIYSIFTLEVVDSDHHAKTLRFMGAALVSR